MAAWKKLPIPFCFRRWYTYLSNRRYPVGVDGVIRNDAGEILIFHHTYRKTPWGMPSGWLGDETDIAAVLSGLSGKDSLRGMLSRLQPKQEVLLLGYGVPMPLPIRSRLYDNEFWKQLLGPDHDDRALPEESDDWLSN